MGRSAYDGSVEEDRKLVSGTGRLDTEVILVLFNQLCVFFSFIMSLSIVP